MHSCLCGGKVVNHLGKPTLSKPDLNLNPDLVTGNPAQNDRVTRRTIHCMRVYAGMSSGRQPLDKIVFPSALVLAFFGLGLSTFSVKQLLSSSSSRVAGRF
ncbi:unnamed protein product [Timema podura]|uniref:Uncharacterized protein n=1 Tax=Timema podura TaxID=61482 RepID=A0ABN7NGE1_TIMPD|nr:unnamed protein product [Timema podura]